MLNLISNYKDDAVKKSQDNLGYIFKILQTWLTFWNFAYEYFDSLSNILIRGKQIYKIYRYLEIIRFQSKILWCHCKIRCNHQGTQNQILQNNAKIPNKNNFAKQLRKTDDTLPTNPQASKAQYNKKPKTVQYFKNSMKNKITIWDLFLAKIEFKIKCFLNRSGLSSYSDSGHLLKAISVELLFFVIVLAFLVVTFIVLLVIFLMYKYKLGIFRKKKRKKRKKTQHKNHSIQMTTNKKAQQAEDANQSELSAISTLPETSQQNAKISDKIETKSELLKRYQVPKGTRNFTFATSERDNTINSFNKGKIRLEPNETRNEQKHVRSHMKKVFNVLERDSESSKFSERDSSSLMYSNSMMNDINYMMEYPSGSGKK